MNLVGVNNGISISLSTYLNNRIRWEVLNTQPILGRIKLIKGKFLQVFLVESLVNAFANYILENYLSVIH